MSEITAIVPSPRRIVMEQNEMGWKITFGDRWEDHLSNDEALGTIAEIIYTGHAHYLKTQAEQDEWKRKYGPREEI